MGGEGCDNMTMILVQFKKPIAQVKDASGGEQPAGDAGSSETQWVTSDYVNGCYYFFTTYLYLSFFHGR